MSTYRDQQGQQAPPAPDSHHLHRDARGLWWVRIGSKNHRVALSPSGSGSWDIQLDGVHDRWDAFGLREQLMERMGLQDASAAASKELRAPMPGKVVDILVKPGQSVAEGDPLVVLEAMKMENVLRSAGDGVVAEIAVQSGQAVEKDAVLVALEN